MAMFSSSGDPDRKQAEPRGGGAREASLSIIAAGMRVVGELITNGVVKVEGAIEGSVRAERQVLIAKGGVVEGDVHTREAIVGGRVTGSIFAEERVEVQPKSVVHGDIMTQKLIVHEGGEVNGSVQMGDPKALTKARSDGRQARPLGAPEAREPASAPTGGFGAHGD